MQIDFGNRNVKGEADEEELLLLLQPHQLHLHLSIGAVVPHQIGLTAVVVGQRPLCHRDGNGRADAPEGFLEDVQQSQRHDAAVLRSARKNLQGSK